MKKSVKSRSQKNSILQREFHISSDKKNLLIGILVSVTVAIALGLLTGYAQYTVAAIGCGKVPVVVSDFMAGMSYSEKSQTSYRVTSTSKFYCTASDAEADGYRKAPW